MSPSAFFHSLLLCGVNVARCPAVTSSCRLMTSRRMLRAASDLTSRRPCRNICPAAPAPAALRKSRGGWALRPGISFQKNKAIYKPFQRITRRETNKRTDKASFSRYSSFGTSLYRRIVTVKVLDMNIVLPGTHRVRHGAAAV